MSSVPSKSRLLLVAIALGAAGCTASAPPEAIARRAQAATSATPLRGAPTGHDVDDACAVVSRGTEGMPRLVRGLRGGPTASGSPDARARWHLRRIAWLYGAEADDVSSLTWVGQHGVGAAGGVTVEYRRESFGIAWDEGTLRVLLAPDGSLLAVRGRLLAARLDAEPTFLLEPDAAIRLALGDRVANPRRIERVLVGPPARPAYRVECTMPTELVRAVRLTIAADDGSVLREEPLEHSDTYAYRVFADPLTLRPDDGPTVDVSPYPGGAPDALVPAFVPPSLVSVDGIQHPSGDVDPFIPGLVSTLRGNHAIAYADRARPDGFGMGDVDVPTTGTHSFDYLYDTSVDALANDTQARAAATHAFYVVSYLHDWYYGSGFDEAAGNAQQSNYGRGGIEGDPMLVQTQDGSNAGARDGANMQVFGDGSSPVLQVSVWTRNRPPDLSASGIGMIPAGFAEYGPSDYSVVAAAAEGLDSVGDPGDGCQPITSAVAGRIALVDRGTCTFESKTQRAQAAGAVGVLVVDRPGSTDPPRLGDDAKLDGTTIPSAGVTAADGAAIRAAMQTGTVTLTLNRVAGLLRDAALDTTVVAHEWGHYLHLRGLRCATRQCQAVSEGMADFVALHLSAEEGDDLDGAFAIGSYAGRFMTSTPGYFGVRRAPYSTLPSRNAFTFRHVSNGIALPTSAPRVATLPDNAEIHNAGEIWASMLWDAYVAFARGGGRSFEVARRTMSDILVAAIRLSPDDPTFLESRDAVLAAVDAVAPDAAPLFAQAFAGRGAGSCSVGPERASTDFAGVIEDFGVGGRVSLGEARLEMDAPSCDWDGFLDAGETGRVVVRVANPGLGPLIDVQLDAASDLPNVAFPSGSQLSIARVEPRSFVDVSIPVALSSGSGDSIGTVTITATATTDCDASQVETLALRVDADALVASSAIDDVESDTTVWFVLGDPQRTTWQVGDEAGNVRFWRATGPSFVADRWLLSPTFTRVAGAPLTLAFDHRFALEADPLSGELRDAVVIEVSNDRGASWKDVTQYGASPYPTGAAIATDTDNPLGGRAAFGGTSAAYPAWQRATLDLGALPGATVRFRFRFVSDRSFASGPFDLDEIAISGIVETPFATVVADPGGCAAEPPDAGLPDADLPPEGAYDGSLHGGAGCSTAPGRGASSSAVAFVLALIVGALHRRTTRRGFRTGS